MVVLLEVSPISTQDLWSFARVTIGFLVISLNKTVLPRLLSLAGWNNSRKSFLEVAKLLPFKNYGGHCGLGNLQCRGFFFCLPQICASTQSCLWALQTVPSTSWLGFCSDMHMSAVRPYIDRWVPFQIISNQLNFPQADSNQGVEASQRWSREVGGAWA